MPAIIDKIRINNENLDKRVKLLVSDKVEIVQLYADGLFSTRELSRMYGVSRRTIQFLLDPKKLEDNIAKRRKDNYYDREKHTRSMAKHRAYKRELLEKGEIQK